MIHRGKILVRIVLALVVGSSFVAAESTVVPFLCRVALIVAFVFCIVVFLKSFHLYFLDWFFFNFFDLC